MGHTIAKPSDDYIEFLKSTGRKSAAISYGSHLFNFQKWLDKKGLQINDTTPVMVEQYLFTVKSQSSVNGALAAIRGYFKHKSQSLPMGHASVIMEMQRLNQISAIKPRKRPRVMKKISLTTDELKKFLKMLRDKKVSKDLYAGIIVLFYFGARSGELAGLLSAAKIDFKSRNMHIQTEKTGVERYISWDARLDPYIKVWYSLVMKKKGGLPYPGQWLTKTMKKELKTEKIVFEKTDITSRTCRRTFETQMRRQMIPDIVIRAVLGHTQDTISDVYTDWTEFQPDIDKAMRENHYMVKSGVI